MGFIRVYTENIIPDKYPNSLANSVHFACKTQNGEYVTMNQGYGILFAKADIREDNTLEERGITEPAIIDKNDAGEYTIVAGLVDAEGMAAYGAKFVVWTTYDFISFEEKGITDEIDGDSASEIEVSDELVMRMMDRWIPIHSVDVEIPSGAEVKSIDEIDSVKATIKYSDGTTALRKIKWDKESITDLGDGKYKLNGEIIPTTTGFPLAPGFADPVIFKWENAWYFLATNDNTEDVGMYVRKADTIEALFDDDTEVHCILPYDESRGLCQTFWAPEFHVLGGELYILFAVSGTQWGPQCHMMKLKKGGRIINESDWEDPVRVIKADGTPLTSDAITLDMTVIRTPGDTYVCWSYREHIGTPLDSGSMLYIATIDEREPWRLTCEPVLLSRPLYGWENNSGTINNEGPYALTIGNTIYLAFSGGAANGYYYVVGYLIADRNADLCNPLSWKKLPMPVMHSLSIPGIQGPGHNSFFVNDDGEIMIAYHAQEREKYFSRCSAYHHVHIGNDGFPHLNVVADLDVDADKRHVEFIFHMQGD